MNSTLSHRPSRHAARASTTPPGASSRTTVSGSVISTMPVSSSTVVVQIVFEPDMAGYSVGSMMMKPASQSGRVAGHDEVRVAGDAAPRLAQQQLPERVAFPLERLHLLEHGRAWPAGRTPPTTTLPISPPAWQPTTVIIRRERMPRP